MNAAVNMVIAVLLLLTVEVDVEVVLVVVVVALILPLILLLLLLVAVTRAVVPLANVAANGDIAVLEARTVELGVKVVLAMVALLRLILLPLILHPLILLLRMVADQSLPRGIVPLMVQKDHASLVLVELIPLLLVALELLP